MTDIQNPGPLALEDWDDSLSKVIQDMDGQPLNVHALLAHHPALLDAWWDFRNYIVSGGELGKRGVEIVVLRVAILTGSQYEWGSHVVRGLKAGLTHSEIDSIKHGPPYDEWDDAEAILLMAIDELDTDRAISSQTLANLEKHYDKRHVLDLLAIHGTYSLLANLLNTWPVDLDEHVADELPEDESLTQL